MRVCSARNITKVVSLIAGIALAGTVATASPVFFTEDFNSGALDPAWTTGGNGHLGFTNGTYEMTDELGDGDTRLYRATVADPAGSFDSSITIRLDFADPNTQTDFKWTMQGNDGSMIVRFNSFKQLSLRHNSTIGDEGELAGDQPINFTDGDILKFNVEYRESSDTINAFYSINGGPNVQLYTGSGYNQGGIGNIITLRSTVALNRFSKEITEVPPSLWIDQWDLSSADGDDITPPLPPGWADFDGDGILDLLEDLYGGNTNDASDALAVFASITNAASGGLTITQALAALEDLRVGSTAVEVAGGFANIQLNIDVSTNLTSTWQASTNVIMVLPADEDVKFYRFSWE